MEREKRQPTWRDPTWRAIPRDVSQDRIDAAHLHINTEHVKRDVSVALGLRALAALEADGVIGRLAKENYSVMGYQENGCEVWRSKTGPEIVNRLGHEAASEVPPLAVRVIGTAPVAQIEVIKDEKVVYSVNPGSREVTLTYLDQEPVPGTSYYYVRVIQEDRQVA